MKRSIENKEREEMKNSYFMLGGMIETKLFPHKVGTCINWKDRFSASFKEIEFLKYKLSETRAVDAKRGRKN